MALGSCERGTLIARVRFQNERRAWLQARRAPWKTLAAAAEEYTDWQVFTLWLRAVIAAARCIPADVEQELESRSPLLLSHIRAVVEPTAIDAEGPGMQVWQAVGEWAEMNSFLVPKREGWLDAVRYFSAASLQYARAWSYWESIDKRWRAAPPAEFPTYAQWQSGVTAVTTLSDGNSDAQRALETVRSLPESEWCSELATFSELIAFSLWMELTLDVEGHGSDFVARELAQRYSGFSLPSSLESKEAVRALHAWVVEHRLPKGNQKELLRALRFHVRHHPAYPALRSYAQKCHAAWPNEHPARLPPYEEWREAANGYFEALGGSQKVPTGPRQLKPYPGLG